MHSYHRGTVYSIAWRRKPKKLQTIDQTLEEVSISLDSADMSVPVDEREPGSVAGIMCYNVFT